MAGDYVIYEMIAVGKSGKEVFAEARRRGIKFPFVQYLPKHENEWLLGMSNQPLVESRAMSQLEFEHQFNYHPLFLETGSQKTLTQPLPVIEIAVSFNGLTRTTFSLIDWCPNTSE